MSGIFIFYHNHCNSAGNNLTSFLSAFEVIHCGVWLSSYDDQELTLLLSTCSTKEGYTPYANPLTNTKATPKLNLYAALHKKQAILAGRKCRVARDEEFAKEEEAAAAKK